MLKSKSKQSGESMKGYGGKDLQKRKVLGLEWKRYHFRIYYIYVWFILLFLLMTRAHTFLHSVPHKWNSRDENVGVLPTGNLQWEKRTAMWLGGTEHHRVTMPCKFAARSPFRRRKNYALFVSVVLLCTLAWLHLAELEGGYTPLRPLLDAESEARRLLAFITHYNYQCNTTAGPIGNWSLWPVCVGREAGINLDSKDTKLMYTIGYICHFICVPLELHITFPSPFCWHLYISQ